MKKLTVKGLAYDWFSHQFDLAVGAIAFECEDLSLKYSKDAFASLQDGTYSISVFLYILISDMMEAGDPIANAAIICLIEALDRRIFRMMSENRVVFDLMEKCAPHHDMKSYDRAVATLLYLFDNESVIVPPVTLH